MKNRILVLAPLGLSLCLFAGFVGCSDETKVEKTEKVSTPEGTAVKQTTQSTKTSGSNPPTSTGTGDKLDPKN